MTELEMTKLEKKVMEFITNNTDVECMECVNMDDLCQGLKIRPHVLRGVVSSLVKKDLIEVEEYDSNMETNYFYWLAGAWD